MINTLISVNTPSAESPKYAFETNSATAPQSPNTKGKCSLVTYLSECV
jgi:hypothetical protein